jgi:hypothetical protein
MSIEKTVQCNSRFETKESPQFRLGETPALILFKGQRLQSAARQIANCSAEALSETRAR